MARKKKETKSIRLIDICITKGLPGAGKTTFIETLENSLYEYDNSLFVYVDKIKEYANSELSFHQILDEARSHVFIYDTPKKVVIDGFFDTDEKITTVFKETVDWYSQTYASVVNSSDREYIFRLIVHYWHPEVDICLFNDSVRNRKKSAEHTIKTTKLEYPNIDTLTKLVSSVSPERPIIIEHVSQKVDIFKEILKKHYVSPNEHIHSESWNPLDDAPKDFELFDEIVFSLKPDISYMLYKKVWKDAKVFVSHKTSSDYYSTNVDNYLCYYCDVSDLREALVENNILPE